MLEKTKQNYTLTAKDPKQRGLKESYGGLLYGALQLATKTFTKPSSKFRNYWWSTLLGDYSLEPPILGLAAHLLYWGTTLLGGLGTTREGLELILELKKYEKIGFPKWSQIQANCTISWGSNILYKKKILSCIIKT